MNNAKNRVRKLLGRVERDLVPMAKLALVDPVTARIWAVRHRAVEKELGKQAAQQALQLLLEVAQIQPEMSQQLARILPEKLAIVNAEERAVFFRLLRVVSREQPQALLLVCEELHRLLRDLSDDKVARFIASALQVYQESPKKAASFLKRESQQAKTAEAQLSYNPKELQRSLTLYARGHCGEDVQVRFEDTKAFSDGKHIYLPARLDLGSEEQNRLAYRALTARNAGYFEFGTMDLDLSFIEGPWKVAADDELEIERMLASFFNPSLARDLFSVFENFRIEQCVRREYPGVARDMDVLDASWRRKRPEMSRLSPAEQVVEALWRAAFAEQLALPLDERALAIFPVIQQQLELLNEPTASVIASVAALLVGYPLVEGLLTQASEGQQIPANIAGGSDYQPLQQDPAKGNLQTSAMGGADRQEELQVQRLMIAMRERGEEVSKQQVRRRVQNNFSEVSDFLDRMEAPAGPRREDGREIASAQQEHQRLYEDAEPLDGDWVYPEWDEHIQDYKPNWTRVHEFVQREGTGEVVDRIKLEYGPEIQRLRKSFEAMRPENLRPQRKVEDGEKIDFDRLIQTRIERKAGFSSSDRFYIRHLPKHRDTAVAFLLDMSSSTNEIANSSGKRILDVEKEALILISEAISVLGDAFAVFGFSGYGREQVAFYIAKDFSQPWNEAARRRVGKMAWKMENRDGAAIRHCVRKLREQDAHSKLLILLSDGKPLDCGSELYYGSYAHADTRAALQEARQQGIHPFCITVDPYGQDYLQSMYGPNRFIVIDQVEKLPRLMPKIYCRLNRR